MGDWSYLSTLLDKVQSHSTVVGKIWMSVLFLFRIFVLGAAADKVWGDEVSEFYCDSLEPGCDHACYNWKFPISFVHYWVLQIVFVSTPTLVYLGHAVHTVHREKRMLELMNDGSVPRKTRYTDDRGKTRIRGVLFGTYITKLVFTILLEVGFCVGQYFIFGSVFVDPFFHCNMSPCADFVGAQCSVSRPTEKSIFIVFGLVVSGISVLLNVLEILYLLCSKRRDTRKKQRGQQNLANVQQYPFNSAWKENQFHMQPMRIPEQSRFDSISKEKDT